MSTVVIDAVEDVRSLLQAASDAGTFSPLRFVAEAKYDTDIKLETDDALHVDVKHAPNDIRPELETRDSTATIVPVLICIRKHFGQSDQDQGGLPSQEEVNDLVTFTNQISRFFTVTRLPTGDATVIEPGEVAWLATLDELRTKRQFSSGVRVICRATEEL